MGGSWAGGKLRRQRQLIPVIYSVFIQANRTQHKGYEPWLKCGVPGSNPALSIQLTHSVAFSIELTQWTTLVKLF